MTYRIDPNPRFWTSVSVPALGQGGDAQDFRACFKALDTDEFGNYDLADPADVRALLEAVLVDVEDVLGTSGTPLPYTTGVRDALIRTPHVRQALVRAYLTAFAPAVAGN